MAKTARLTADYVRDAQGRLWKWTRYGWRLMRHAVIRTLKGKADG